MPRPWPAGGAGGGRPARGQMAVPDTPPHTHTHTHAGSQTPGIGSNDALVAHASFPSCFAIGIGAVFREPGRDRVRWPLCGLQSRVWVVRVTRRRVWRVRLGCQGPDGSRPRAATESDGMSAARGARSGQNVRGREVGLSGAGAVLGSGGQNVPGRVACPFTRQRLPSCCVYGGVRCGGLPKIPAHTLQTCLCS